MTIFDKVFLMASATSGLPISNLAADGPGYDSCDHSWITASKGSIQDVITGCAAAIFKVRIDTSMPTSLAKAGSGMTTSKNCRVAELAKASLRRQIGSLGASLTLLGDDEEGSEFMTMNLRNQVVRGAKYWEKLYLYSTIWETFPMRKGEGPRVLHFKLVTHGYYAAGGDDSKHYPPDSDFNHSLEPTFSSNLSDFNNSLGVAVQNSLVANCK